MPPPLALSRSLLSLLAAWTALAGLAPPASAAPGDLDPSFGGDGKVTTNFSPGVDEGNDAAVQRDGRIVAAGVADATEGGDPTFAIARYLIA